MRALVITIHALIDDDDLTEEEIEELVVVPAHVQVEDPEQVTTTCVRSSHLLFDVP